MSGSHETISSQLAFNGAIFDVFVDQVRLPSGEIVERQVVRHPGAVGIVAIKEDHVLMVTQMRHAAGKELLEIPAGKLDVQGEEPIECARRELFEETGYRAGTMKEVISFYNSPGFCDELFRIFIATELTVDGDPPTHDGGEPIASRWVPLSETSRMILDGTILDAKTMIGLVVAKLHGEEAN